MLSKKKKKRKREGGRLSNAEQTDKKKMMPIIVISLKRRASASERVGTRTRTVVPRTPTMTLAASFDIGELQNRRITYRDVCAKLTPVTLTALSQFPPLPLTPPPLPSICQRMTRFYIPGGVIDCCGFVKPPRHLFFLRQSIKAHRSAALSLSLNAAGQVHIQQLTPQ